LGFLVRPILNHQASSLEPNFNSQLHFLTKNSSSLLTSISNPVSKNTDASVIVLSTLDCPLR